MDRKSFVFYRSFYEAITDYEVGLSRNEQLDIFLAIAEYCLNGNEIHLTGRSKGMWILIKPQLEANKKKYENAKKGGAPGGNSNAKKTTKNNQKQPKNNQKQPNVNVNDNVNENGKIQPMVETMPDYIKERIAKLGGN